MKLTNIKIWQSILSMVVLALGLWLVNNNFPQSNQIVVNLTAGHDQPMLTRLGPEVRIKIEPSFQTILESPVYFDLRTLPWFGYARIELTFREVGTRLAGIGGQAAGEWNYVMSKPLAVESLGDGWQRAIFDFDLSTVIARKNVRRFLISTQNIDPARPGQLDVQSLKIIIHK